MGKIESSILVHEKAQQEESFRSITRGRRKRPTTSTPEVAALQPGIEGRGLPKGMDVASDEALLLQQGAKVSDCRNRCCEGNRETHTTFGRQRVQRGARHHLGLADQRCAVCPRRQAAAASGRNTRGNSAQTSGRIGNILQNASNKEFRPAIESASGRCRRPWWGHARSATAGHTLPGSHPDSQYPDSPDLRAVAIISSAASTPSTLAPASAR